MNVRKILDKAVENWIAKAVAIALAIFLFLFHRMTTLETRFLSIPLTVETSGALVPASQYTRLVRVSLRGESTGINSIQEGDIEAYIDLRKHETEGWYRAPVIIRKKGEALTIAPLEISVDPAEIHLQLDRKANKRVPLTANIRGNVESGYTLVSHSLTPTQVIVDGPASLLDSITELYTDYIDIEGRRADFSVIVNILNRDPLIAIRGNRLTEFKGFINSRSAPVRNFDEIPIILKDLDPQFEVQVTYTGSVGVEGSASSLERFVPPENFLSVDCSSIDSPGDYTLPVLVELSNGLALSRHEPEEIILSVTVREIE